MMIRRSAFPRVQISNIQAPALWESIAPLRTTIILLLIVATSFCVAVSPSLPPAIAQKRVQYDLYGDPLPIHAIARLGTVKLRHNSKSIRSIAFHPTNPWVASLGADGELFMWNVNTYDLERNFVAQGAIHSFAFSPDGMHIAAVWTDTSNGYVHGLNVWDVKTGERQNVIPMEDLTYKVAFSPNGRYLVASGIHRGTYVWNWDDILRNRSDKASIPKPMKFNRATAFCFSSNQESLALLSGTDVTFWDLRTRKRVHEYSTKNLYSPGDTEVALVNQGESIAIISRSIGALIIDVQSGRHIMDRRVDGDWVPIAISQDKNWMVASNEGHIEITDLSNGVNVSRMGMNGFARCGAVSKDGRTLALSVDNAVQIWSVSPPREKTKGFVSVDPEFGTVDAATKSYASKDGLWNLGTGKLLYNVPFNSHVCFTTSNEPIFITRSETGISVRELRQRKLLRQFPWISASKTTKLEFSKIIPFSHHLLLARLSDDGTRHLTCYELSQKIEEVWDLTLPGDLDAIDDVQLSVDGKRVVVVGARQLSVKPLIWVYDRESSTWLQYMIDHSVYFSPDLKTAAFVRSEGDKEETYTTRILALDSRREYRTHSDMVEPLYIFTPDGQAYARAADKLTVETVESAERRLEYQLSKAESVCFDTEGKLLAVSGTGVIAVIDLKSKLPIAKYRVASRITRLLFTKDDRYIISHHANATALVWPVRKP